MLNGSENQFKLWTTLQTNYFPKVPVTQID